MERSSGVRDNGYLPATAPDDDRRPTSRGIEALLLILTALHVADESRAIPETRTVIGDTFEGAGVFSRASNSSRSHGSRKDAHCRTDQRTEMDTMHPSRLRSTS